MNYILMNKDFAWLSFSSRRNEFDEVECSEHEWYTELRPWGYHNLTDYLTGRQQAPEAPQSILRSFLRDITATTLRAF